MTRLATGTWYADELLAAHARDAADAPALILDDGVVTWAELDERVGAVAEMVVEHGDGAGARVALLADAPVDAIAAILGILRAGAIAAPVPSGLTERERAAALEVLEPALTLRIVELTGRRAERAPGVHAARVSGASRDPEVPALIVLTSGTTGRPKGVVLSVRAMAASADAWLAALPPATGWVLPLGVAHVAGLGIVWRALADRVPIRLVAPGDPAALLAALREEPAPSHVSLVPGQLRRVLDACHDGAPPSTLLAVPLGGGAIPAALVLRATRAGWPVIPTYGLSEMGSGVTALPASEAADAPGTAGRPLPGVTLSIEDAGRDGVGEIVVRGPSRSSGYLGDAPVAAREPFRTADLGRIDAQGRLVVVDRRTDRIVRGGENIAPAEVEHVLEAHPAVAEAAVVGRPDETWGREPVAAVVLRDGVEDPGDAVLAAHARAALAGHKVPVAFTRLDTLPRTSGGKLRREAVRSLLGGEPAGELARPGGDAIGWRVTGTGSMPVLLLHGTLSTSAQLDRLATALAAAGDITVHAIDRRGSGTSRLADPRTLDVVVHVDDLVAYLDARRIAKAVVVGVSFGGVVALELAARHPERVIAVAAYEPPYGLLAEGESLAWFRRLGDDTAAAHRDGGPAAAAELFLRAVAGDAAWDRLPERARRSLAREGDGALADVSLTGLDPDGLARIAAPVLVLTGGASQSFYLPLAQALVARIGGARLITLPGATHTTPITDPAPVVAAIRTFLELPA